MKIARMIAAAALGGFLLLPSSPPPAATALECPDVEVLFARGTGEPPGVGWIGQQFIDALRWRTWGRSIQVYPVGFPAVPEFGPSTAGIADAAHRIGEMTAVCPNTHLVLGGYSRGAALIGYVTDPAALAGFGATLPPEATARVAAVALLGKPSSAFLQSIGAPPVQIEPPFAAKTIDLCAPGDPICSAGTDGAAHAAYSANGMTAHAADFVVGHLGDSDGTPGQPL